MIEIRGTEQLHRLAAVYAAAPQETRRAVQDGAKAMGPELVRDAQARASGPIENAIAGSGRITATDKGMRAVFGSAGSFHGTPLRAFARPWEWGGPRERVETYLSRQRDTKRAMRVTRHVQRQIPASDSDGRFVSPAVEGFTPRLAQRWAELIVEAVAHGR